MRRMMRAATAAGVMIVGLAGAVRVVPAPRAPAEDAAVIAAMDTMIQAEYRTGAEYARVLRDLGPVSPFFSLVHEEDLHAELIAALYRGRGLRAPAARESADAAAPYATLAQACRAALEGETRNLARYDGYLARDLPRDVRRVFEHNRRERARSHAAAFERCAAEQAPVEER